MSRAGAAAIVRASAADADVVAIDDAEVGAAVSIDNDATSFVRGDTSCLPLATTSEALATNKTAAAARRSLRAYHARAFGTGNGMTPAGTSSSASKIRDDAATRPLASAIAAAHWSH